MAEKLCELKKKGGGGGKYTETSLWTNSAPTSDFPQTTVTLSDSMSNYKYLAFAYKGVKSSTTVVRAVVSVEDLGNMSITENSTSPNIRLGGQGSDRGYSRYVIKASDTTITFGAARASNSVATDNSRAIPVEILGLNELKPGTDVGIVTNGASFSAKTSVTINCKVGDYIALGYVRSTSGYNVYWNGTTAYQSSDYVAGYSLSTNHFMYIMKASQTSNTFSVASGATVTGGYQIFSLG